MSATPDPPNSPADGPLDGPVAAAGTGGRTGGAAGPSGGAPPTPLTPTAVPAPAAAVVQAPVGTEPPGGEGGGEGGSSGSDGEGGSGGEGGSDGEGGDETLPCGRELGELWAAWDEGRRPETDPHTATCPHCTYALEGLRRLDASVRRVREEDAVRREAQPVEALTTRVMDIVRRELRPGRSVPIGDARDDAWIVESAAGRTFRAAADTLTGVHAGSCRVTALADDGTARRLPGGAPLPRGPVRVAVEIAVAPHWPLPRAAEAVRERIDTAAREELGMEVGAVDVTVVDLLLDGEDAEGAADAHAADADDAAGEQP